MVSPNFIMGAYCILEFLGNTSAEFKRPALAETFGIRRDISLGSQEASPHTYGPEI